MCTCMCMCMSMRMCMCMSMSMRMCMCMSMSMRIVSLHVHVRVRVHVAAVTYACGGRTCLSRKHSWMTVSTARTLATAMASCSCALGSWSARTQRQ